MQILGLVVRLRAELTIITVLLFARLRVWPWLNTRLGHTYALLTVTVLLLSILVIPASRRYLVRRWWCVTTRHRMRACFLQTRTMTYNGKLPFLLWSRPSPVGERVRVWLPAGLSVKDLEQVSPQTAAACWAADVRTTPSRRQAALVIVDVIRRDPLTGGALTPHMVNNLDPTDSDAGYVPGFGLDKPMASPEDAAGPLPSRTTLPDPTPHRASPTEPTGSNGNTPTGRSRNRKDPTTTGTGTGTTGTADATGNGEPPVTGFGGVDVSDYL